MGGTIRKRYFGVEGHQFRLEIKSVEGAPTHYTLIENEIVLHGENVEQKTLQLLECLTSHRKEIIPRTTILREVWPEERDSHDPSGHIDRHTGRLRKVFRDDVKNSRFIATHRNQGLAFLLDVREEREQLPSSAPITAELRGVLNVLKKHPCHRYHLTLDKKRKPVWIYTKIDFTKNEPVGEKLSAKAPILLKSDATDFERGLDMYNFEAEPYGSHLLIKSRRSDLTSDMCVDLFPHASTQYLPFCGARINDTWFPTTVASSISILSLVVDPKFESVREGLVEEPDLVAELEKLWQENNKIVRLPTDWSGLPDAQTGAGRHPGKLFKVGVPYYHYHLTLTKKGEQKWIGKIIKFETGKDGQLFANTAILPSPEADRADYMYEVTPRFVGPHLVLQLVAFGDPDDVTVQLYPYTGTSRFPYLYSATIHRSQTDTFVSSMAILSQEPFGKEVEGPVDKVQEAKLFAAWDKHKENGSPEIVRLPFTSRPPLRESPAKPAITDVRGNDEGTIEQRWDERACLAMLNRSSKTAKIRIFVSFFIKDIDLFGTVNRLLTEAGSSRTIEIMIMDPDTPHLLEMRYGTEARRFRKDTLTGSVARTDIRNQIERLTLVHQEVKDAKGKGTLRVYVYDVVPTFIAYQSGEEALLGMLLIHGSANLGPMIRVNQEQPLWTVIKDNWNTLLEKKRSRLVVGESEAAIWD